MQDVCAKYVREGDVIPGAPLPQTQIYEARSCSASHDRLGHVI